MRSDNDYRYELMSKNGFSTMLLAREMLSYYPEDRINTVEYYADKFNVGRGTVQYAMKYMISQEAVQMVSRGHRGTFIIAMNHEKLMQIGGITSITGSMPLPYSLRYEGLATGLYDSFKKSSIPFSISYSRGSETRTEQVKGGRVDFTVVSKKAGKHIIQRDSALEILLEFDNKTYVGQRVLILRDKSKREIEGGMRVGIDYSSIDQYEMTKEICKEMDVKFVSMYYSQTLNMLRRDEIDVAIWNGDEIYEKGTDLTIVPLDNDMGDDMVAVIIGLSKNAGLNNIIKKMIIKDKVQKVQQQVMNNEIVPAY